MNIYITSDDGGVTNRPMNEPETTEYELFLASTLEERTRKATALAARTAARAALLNRLGITAEEAQLLLGGM